MGYGNGEKMEMSVGGPRGQSNCAGWGR